MKKKTLPLLAALLLLSGCGAAKAPTEDAMLAMDTVMSFTVYGSSADKAIDAARDKISEIESRLSKTLPESEVYRVNAAGGAEVSSETAELISLTLEYSALTEGAFDITIGPVMEAWGFTGDTPAVPDDEALEKALSLTGFERVRVEGARVTLEEPGMSIDLGGVGKGYAGDEAAEAMREAGVRSALLYLGGNVVTIGAKPDGSLWSIAVTDPASPGDIVGLLRVSDSSVVTSGGYERFFEANGERYHHIIDPAVGRPAESDLLSVTVISESSTRADILSTALYVMGAERAEQLWRQEADFGLVLVRKDKTVLVTSNAAESFQFTGEDAGYKLEII